MRAAPVVVGLALLVAACGSSAKAAVPAATTTSSVRVVQASTVDALYNGLSSALNALPTTYFSTSQSDVAARWSAEASAARRVASTFGSLGFAVPSADADSLADDVAAVGQCVAGGDTPSDPLAARFVATTCAGSFGQSQSAMVSLKADLTAAFARP